MPWDYLKVILRVTLTVGGVQCFRSEGRGGLQSSYTAIILEGIERAVFANFICKMNNLRMVMY